MSESPRDTAEEKVAAFDFETPASSAFGAKIRVGAVALSACVLLGVMRTTLSPLLVTNRLAAMNGDEYEGHRYGMTAAERQAIFAEMAALEIPDRKRNIEQNSWGGHLWSREDDRGYREMTTARQIARQRNRSLTQVYMVLDEAVRERWPAADGQPLPATTPPLDPRKGW